ncbi:MAG: SDR family NAD(P)-dependent oxidoreductase [Tannerellaceae bacterium]
MDLGIQNRRAFVTGSTAGIGLEIARSLLREGVSVIINGRTKPSVDLAMKSLHESHPDGDVAAFIGDLSDEDTCKRLHAMYPILDILINNIGMYESVEFEDITSEQWNKIFQTNVMSGVMLSKLYLASMKKRNWGRIVFISSESALNVPTDMIHYGVTKTAQLSVARGLAETCTGTGVTVNSVLPGPTLSPGVETFLDKLSVKDRVSKDKIEAHFFKKYRSSSIIRRFIKPEEIGDIVAFIASERAAVINGAALKAEGGLVRTIY